MKKSKGFTLIELMVVVVILGILAVVVAPRIPDLVKKAKEGATKGALSTLRSTLNIYYSDTEGLYPMATAASYPSSSTVLVAALVPKYIKAIPVVKAPTAHPPTEETNTVYIYDNIPASITENGRFGWGYGSVYGTASYGNIIVHCQHTDTSGNYWYSY